MEANGEMNLHLSRAGLRWAGWIAGGSLAINGALAQAEPPDALPERAAYVAMLRADQERDIGRAEAAAASYREALERFLKLASEQPDYKSEIVARRIAYCRSQLAELESASAPVPPESSGPAVSKSPNALERLDILEKAFAALQEAQSRLSAQLEEARRERDAAVRARDVVEESRRALRSRLAEMESRLAEAEARTQEAREAAERAAGEREQAVREVEALRAQGSRNDVREGALAGGESAAEEAGARGMMRLDTPRAVELERRAAEWHEEAERARTEVETLRRERERLCARLEAERARREAAETEAKRAAEGEGRRAPQQAAATRPGEASAIPPSVPPAEAPPGEEAERSGASSETGKTALPTGPEAWMEAAERALAEGDFAAASTAAESALRLDPKHRAARLLLVRSAIGRGDLREARRLAERLARDFRNDATVERLLGQIAELEKNPALAIRHYRRAVALDAENPDGHRDLAAACCATGRLSEAIAAFETVVRLKPDDARAHFNLAALLASTNEARRPEAREHYARAIELGEERDEALEALLQP